MVWSLFNMLSMTTMRCVLCYFQFKIIVKIRYYLMLIAVDDDLC
jgi:hypothetical protein